MLTLSLFEEYNRLDVHNIFSPNTVFTPQSGTWGLHGIVAIPARNGDFVFFVTYGQKQGEHIFDEGITEQGVFSWQSQPKQSLVDHKVLQFINHNELRNVIYLFLRTSSNQKYTYLGPLKYLFHDAEREKPVYFQWQLLQWPIPDYVINRIGLSLIKQDTISDPTDINISTDSSLSYNPKTKGISTRTFRARKAPDYSILDANNRELGLLGELYIIGYEKNQLKKQGRIDLAEKVRHISLLEGDGAGYDILSYTLSGVEKYIEVKTTSGPQRTSFYMSANELAFAKFYSENYYLYRVFQYNLDTETGEVEIFKGLQEQLFDITPTQYRLKYLG